MAYSVFACVPVCPEEMWTGALRQSGVNIRGAFLLGISREGSFLFIQERQLVGKPATENIFVNAFCKLWRPSSPVSRGLGK